MTQANARQHRRRQGLILGIAAALLISLTNVFSRLHFEAGSNPVTFMVGRYLLFVFGVVGVLALLGRLPRIERHHHRDILIAGTLNVFGATCLAFAIERLQVGLAIAVLYLFPIFTLIMDSAVRRTRPAATTVFALAIAFAGLVLALDVQRSWPDPVGVLFALGAASGISASFVWMDWRLAALSDAGRVVGLSVVALVLVIALAGVQGGIVWPLPSVDAWVTLLVATATFGAAYAAMFVAIARIGAPNTSVLMNLEPPATAVFALLILGDRLAPTQLAGIALVVAAVLFAQRKAR